ncbi:hypothetical protein B0T26DRAFT_638091, partial [Lasiosphaeria miniovina]
YRTCSIADHTLDDANLETRCPLDDGQYGNNPRYTIGTLDELPSEIIINVLLRLDVPTLTLLRRVNRRAMAIVSSLYPYRMIRQYCPDVLRAVISLNASSYDYQTLWDALPVCSKCDGCDLFGSYLYIVTGKRVCYLCFTSGWKYIPTMPPMAWDAGLSQDAVGELPSVLSLPGLYTQSRDQSFNRIVLIDRQAAVDYDVLLGQQRLQARRFMAVISAPFFRSCAGQPPAVDWGVFCGTCRDKMDPDDMYFRIKYTMDQVAHHAQQHEGSKTKDQVSQLPELDQASF